jgi:hypothetical protein
LLVISVQFIEPRLQQLLLQTAAKEVADAACLRRMLRGNDNAASNGCHKTWRISIIYTFHAGGARERSSFYASLLTAFNHVLCVTGANYLAQC